MNIDIIIIIIGIEPNGNDCFFYQTKQHTPYDDDDRSIDLWQWQWIEFKKKQQRKEDEKNQRSFLFLFNQVENKILFLLHWTFFKHQPSTRNTALAANRLFLFSLPLSPTNQPIQHIPVICQWLLFRQRR